jgi:hypothetical protein
MTRPKSEKRRRTNTVGVRVSDDELEQIQAFAAAHDLTLSKTLLIGFKVMQTQEAWETVSQLPRRDDAELPLASGV